MSCEHEWLSYAWLHLDSLSHRLHVIEWFDIYNNITIRVEQAAISWFMYSMWTVLLCIHMTHASQSVDFMADGWGLQLYMIDLLFNYVYIC